MELIVTATSLNLRSEPRVRPGNRVALLAQGQRVTAVGSATDPAWIMVNAEIDGQTVTGYASRQYLAAPGSEPAPNGASGLEPVHMRRDDPGARRDRAGKRAFPLAEPGAPKRVQSETPAQRRQSLSQIVDWLDVERSARYAPAGGRTYCNIYAHDYCYLADTYLPRVWWTPRAASDLLQGRVVAPQYDRTIHELNANSLFEWLRQYGDRFGWRRVFDPTELQDCANGGGVGVICAQRVELNQPGHIAVVVPEAGAHAAIRTGDTVTAPLQSQAGSTNRKYQTTTWWNHLRFRQFGWWVHA